MNKVQTLRLLVSRPQLTRLTTCQFCLSNHRENNARHKSVFERYVDFQRENKIPLDYEGFKEEVKVTVSSPTVVEIEPSDKIPVHRLGQARPVETNSGSWTGHEMGSDRLKTEIQNKDDQVNISISNKSHNLSKPNKDVQYEDQSSKTLKSEVELKSVSNVEKSETLVNRDTGTTLNYNIDNANANPHLKYILNCELIPDVNSDLKKEDYLLFHEHLEKTQIDRLPSVSNVVGKLNSRHKGLLIWKERQIQLLGDDGFLNLMRGKRKLGIDFHKTIHRYLSGEKSVEISPDIQGYWDSVKHVLDSLDEDDVKMLEGGVSHPLLHYVGGFDCIAIYRNTLCIIEWKTSSRPKPFLSTTMDYPVQSAAYLGAINASFHPGLKRLGPVTNAVIVVAYNSGQPAHVHYLNDRMVEKYWNQWLRSLYTYWSRIETSDELRLPFF